MSEDRESGFASDIFELTDYQLRRPLRREFMPWHKPRKHFIRQNQWGQEIEWLLSNRAKGDQSGLCYLGLPGPDLLDVRYIYRRFCTEGRRLTFLGFDDSARPESSSREALNVSLDEVRRLTYVDARSDVLGDNFRKLADDNSIAWDKAKILGPFDIINLDLCGHIGLDPPKIDHSMYDAIHQVCGLQNRRPHPWSLFITSRVNKDSFLPEVLTILLDRLRDNIGTCREFKQALERWIGDLDYADDAVAASNDEEFFGTAAVVLSNWLLGLAQGMRCEFSVASVAVYRVYGRALHPDMLSLILRFEPVPKIDADPARLATSSPTFPNECTQAARIPGAIATMVDVDDLLARERRLWRELRDSTAQLLQEARYDPVQYQAWADQLSG
jgi:hypothetical protein